MKEWTRVSVVGVVLASCGLGLAFIAGTGCSFGSSTPASEPDAHFGVEAGGFDGASADGQGGGGDGGAATDGGGGEGGSEAAAGDGGCSAGGGSGTWTCVGSMATARTAAGIAVLPGGKALVAGGWNATSGVLTSAEVFDSVNETFTPTTAMSYPHLWGAWGAGWPALPGGKVLVAGGLDATGALETQAEIDHPAAGSFATTGPLLTGVISMFPVVLADSSVLFLGGWNSTTGAPPTPGWMYVGSGTSEVQRYVPSTGAFADTGPLAENRLVGCNVVLSTGHVLAIGGSSGQSGNESNIEDYDPAAGTWTTVGTLSSPATCTFAFVVSSTKVLLLNNDAAAAGRSSRYDGLHDEPDDRLPRRRDARLRAARDRRRPGDGQRRERHRLFEGVPLLRRDQHLVCHRRHGRTARRLPPSRPPHDRRGAHRRRHRCERPGHRDRRALSPVRRVTSSDCAPSRTG